MSDIVQTPNSPSPGTPMSPNFPFNSSGVDADTQPNPTLLVGANGTNSDGSPRTQVIGAAPSGGLSIEPTSQAEGRENTRNASLVSTLSSKLDAIATAIGGNAVGDGVSITAASPFSTIGASGGPYTLKLDPTGTIQFTIVDGLITNIT